jgi:hypothetical protein
MENGGAVEDLGDTGQALASGVSQEVAAAEGHVPDVGSMEVGG